jgi:hypothetical protein
MSDSPPQKSGVSGDGREAVREQVYAILAKAYYNGRTDTVAHAPGGTLEGESNQHAVATVNFQTDDLMSLLDAQFDAGLAAAESALPEKRNAKYGDGMGTSYYILSGGFDGAIDQARQSIQALKRKERI